MWLNQAFYPASAFMSADRDEARNPQRFIHAAVIANANNINNIVNYLTYFLYTATAYLAHLLLRNIWSNTHAKAKEQNALAHFD